MKKKTGALFKSGFGLYYYAILADRNIQIITSHKYHICLEHMECQVEKFPVYR